MLLDVFIQGADMKHKQYKNRLFKSRSLVFPLAIFFSHLIHAEDSMDKLQALKEFESFYDAIQPAQENSDEAFAWFSQVPDPLFNAVIHLSCDRVSEKVDDLIKKASQDRPLSFWVHSENRAEGLVDVLESRNFRSIITCPLMAWNVKSTAKTNADIRPADTEVFHEIISVVYQMDPAVKREFRKIMDDLECENYILYADGKPVSTCTLFVQGAAGGIFNDATIPERREASGEIMRFVKGRAHELGLERLIVLSSPEGEKLYADLGFENLLPIEIFAR